MNEKETIEVNGMQFQKTRLCPNFQGIYDSDPCQECHLDIHWVDYGGVRMCGKVECAGTNCKYPYVWTVVGGIEDLKSK